MKNKKTKAIGTLSVLPIVVLFLVAWGSAAVAKPPGPKEDAAHPPKAMPRGHFPRSMEDAFHPTPPHDDMGKRERPPGDFPPYRSMRGENGISKQQRMRLKQFVKEHFPKMHEELQRLRDRNPERAKKRMVNMAPGFLRLMKTMNTDPEKGSLMIRERRLDMRLRRLGHQYRRTAEDDSRRDKIEAEIRTLCAEAFDCRQAIREMGTRELEARVAELRDRHREAGSMREQLIDRAVRDHLEGPPGGDPRRAGPRHRPFGKP